MVMKKNKTRQELLEENQSLQESLNETREVLSAIQRGEIDALVVTTLKGEQVYTLKGAEQPYRLMVENMTEGAVTLDSGGSILYCNQNFANMIERPLEKVIGSSIFQYIASPDLPNFHALLSLGKENVGKAELYFRNSRGSLIPALLSIRNLRELNLFGSEPGALCLVITDLTEQKRNEELMASERLAKLIFEQTTEAFIVCNYEGVIIRSSGETQRLTEKSIYLNQFDHVFNLKFAGGSKKGQLFTIQGILKGEVLRKEEFFQEDEKGGYHDILLSAGPLQRGDEVLGCVVILVDITERNQAEKELRKRSLQLEEANKDLEAFIYSVSHDLQGPIRAIDGFAKMILKDYVGTMNPEMKRRFDVIIDNTSLSGQLIEGLLNLSRIGRRDLSYSLLDMKQIFESAWKDVEALNQERKIEWRWEELLPAYGDGVLIRQVAYNLLSNAAKFTGNRKQAVIEIRSYLEKDQIIYSIKDNGTGFDMKYYGKLFGVFQRLHNRKDFEGTGIGLAIVNRIIKRHGGRVWAEGKPNQGATFYFSLLQKPHRTSKSVFFQPNNQSKTLVFPAE
jgi:two-component system sensor kinase